MTSSKDVLKDIDTDSLKKEIKEELIKREIMMGLDDDEIDLGELVGVIWKRIRMVVALPLFIAVFAAVYSLSMPNFFQANTTIFVHVKGGGGGMAALLGNLPFGGGLMGGGGGSAEYLMAYLKSRAMTTEIIKRFNIATDTLIVGENLEKLEFDDILKIMDGVVNVTKDKDGLITVAVETKSATVSADLAEGYLELLNTFSKGPAKEKHRFIESQLTKVSKELEEAEIKFKAFQDKNKLVAIGDQTKGVIEKLVKLQAERVESEIALTMQNSLLKASGNVPELVKVEAQKLGEEAKLKALGEVISETEKLLEGLPTLALDYARLMRELNVKEKVFATLTEQNEMAKISEAEEGSQFEVIDHARPPDRKSKPKRAMIVILAGSAAGMLAVFLAFLLEYFEKRRHAAMRANGNKISAVVS
ncbi:MAG: Wzz/FepE/Etk N-terminal domain-containing protein [Candidatus Ozemobacteraceae bacterium]